MQKPTPAKLHAATFGLLLLAAALTAIYGFLGRQRDLQTRVPEFVALTLLAGALYLIGVFLVETFTLGHGSLTLILASALLFRFFVLPTPPSLSHDVYRYQWEGRVLRAKINPYSVYPAMPGLEWLVHREHPLETGSATPTVYPPLSEWAFSKVKTVPGYKRLFTALDVLSLGAVLLILYALEQPLHRALIYAWNPSVIIAFAMCGHHDSLAILTLLAAQLFIIGQRPILSIASLALSFLSKFFPAILLPLFLKRTRLAYAGVFAALALTAYLPYLGAGRQLLSGLSNYTVGWEGNDSLFRLIRQAGNSKAQAELVAGVILLALLAHVLRKRLEPLRASLLLIAALLLLSPNAFPWYFTWTVPLLCFYPSAPWLLMTVTCVLGYSPVVAYAAGQPYRDSPFILTLEYAPALAWLGFNAWRSIRNSK